MKRKVRYIGPSPLGLNTPKKSFKRLKAGTEINIEDDAARSLHYSDFVSVPQGKPQLFEVIGDDGKPWDISIERPWVVPDPPAPKPKPKPAPKAEPKPEPTPAAKPEPEKKEEDE